MSARQPPRSCRRLRRRKRYRDRTIREKWHAHDPWSGCFRQLPASYQAAREADIPNYWAYAGQYVLNDNAFSDLEGPTFPNHMFTVAGASGPDVPHSAKGNPTGSVWGCDAPAATTVALFNGTRQFP